MKPENYANQIEIADSPKSYYERYDFTVPIKSRFPKNRKTNIIYKFLFCIFCTGKSAIKTEK